MKVIDKEEHASTFGLDYHTNDRELHDFNDISSLFLLGGMLFTNHTSTMDEIQQQSSVTNEAEETLPLAGVCVCPRAVSSFQNSKLNEDENNFLSKTKSINLNINIKHSTSNHSIASAGIDNRKETPHNFSGRRKKFMYEQDPSDDPAFEKRRKKAITSKRDRERKKLQKILNIPNFSKEK